LEKIIGGDKGEKMKNLDYIDEDLLEKAEEMANLSDKEILALTAGAKNEPAIANYQMAMALKLRGSLNSLDNNIKKLNKSTKISSWIMGIMTFFILILTGIIVWKGL